MIGVEFLLIQALVLAFGILLYIFELEVIVYCAISFVFGLITIPLLSKIIRFFIIKKKKKKLREIIENIAKNYCKDKYNREVECFDIKFIFNEEFFLKVKLDLCIVYLDDKKSTYVKIFLNSNLSVRTIRSNIKSKMAVDFEERLETILKKFNIKTQDYSLFL